MATSRLDPDDPRDQEAIAVMAQAIEDRFWERVLRWGPDDCWHWMGRMTKNGYGTMTVVGPIGAHVVSYAMAYEIPPDGIVVRHTCDNRGCVNPRHLIPGTHAENMRDMVERGRHSGGGARVESRAAGATRKPMTLPTWARSKRKRPKSRWSCFVYDRRTRRSVPAKRVNGKWVPMTDGEIDVLAREGRL